jgi:hypothetical protein
MWPAWSTRLLSDLRGTAVVRSTLSCATLLAGSTVTPAAAVRLLGSTVTPNAMNQRLWVLRNSAYWPEISAALILLSDYLDEEGAPIDYARRRDLDYSTLISEAQWEQMLGQFQDRPGEESPPVTFARHYLVERLTGGPPQPTVAAVDVPDEYTQSWSAMRQKGVAGLCAAFDDCARSFLARLAIDEPVVWRPPFDLLADLGLPVPATN